MNILFINLPYSGHIIPTLGLVKQLVSRGHSITYLLTEDWQDKIIDTGANFVGYDNSPKLSSQIKSACAEANKIAKKFDIIVYEQFFFLGKHIADKHSIPAVRIFTPLATNRILTKEFISGGGFEIFRFKWACRAFTKDVAQGFDLKTDCWLEEILENPPGLNLVYTLKAFQPYESDFPDENYKFIGASIYERQDKTNFSFPQRGNPIIYISLGTIANKSLSFYKKCISAFKNQNVTVIMSVGNSIQLKKLGKIPNNFLILPYVPQLDVLKKASVFITHGGMNSITESMYFGVPMVVIPHMADQHANAKRIEELKLGLKLNKQKINPRLLRNTVFSVMDSQIICENIKNMSEKFRLEDANLKGAEFIEQYYNKYNQSK